MLDATPIFLHDALSPWETQLPASPQAWVARVPCVLLPHDELSLGKDLIWKCHAQECQNAGSR
jgi:hypothetical protein